MLLKLGRYSFGFTHDLIANDGDLYLERWILWLGGSLRVHRFFASDEDRAAHDHPWWFVTIPFSTYAEFVTAGQFNDRGNDRCNDRCNEKGNEKGNEKDGSTDEPKVELKRLVRPYRPHFRSARFRHRVELLSYPTWTLVLTGAKSREWGFWAQGTFVHSDDWQPVKAGGSPVSTNS